jgi:hypothetical protein
MPSAKKIVDCRCCGKPGQHYGNGYRRACHTRWMAAGRPEEGPPPPLSPQEVGRLGGQGYDEKGMRIETYRRLRKYRRLTPTEAAAQIRVSVRTAHRYEAELRDDSRISW